jgi:hypothetical protein
MEGYLTLDDRYLSTQQRDPRWCFLYVIRFIMRFSSIQELGVTHYGDKLLNRGVVHEFRTHFNCNGNPF